MRWLAAGLDRDQRQRLRWKAAALVGTAGSDEAELSRLRANAVVVGARAPLTPAQSAWLKRSFAQSVQYSGQHTIYLRK